MFKEGIANQLWGISLVLAFLLLCIWQIPGTIAIRYSLLALLLPISLLLCFWRRQAGMLSLGPLSPLVWLALLTSWIILVIGVWSIEPSLSWKEFRGQWLTALGAGLIGALLARAALAESVQRAMTLITAVFWALLVQVLLHDVLDIGYLFMTGEVPFRQAPVLYVPEILSRVWDGRPIVEAFTQQSGDKFSYVNNTLGALVVAELVQRVMIRKRWLPIGWPVLLLSLVAVLACTYLLQFRNGNIGLLLLIGLATLMVLARQAQRWTLRCTGLVTIAALSTLVFFGAVLYKSDVRWQNFAGTISIAWDTQTHQAWRLRDLPYPTIDGGSPVEAGSYLRIAWMKEGLKLIADSPLGIGYNRNAFGDSIDRKYEMNGVYRGGHSHSGLIDFGIANGIPGLLLWVSFLGALFYAGWVAFRQGLIAPPLTLMFIVSGFLSRSIVDSNLRDHMLQEFMFLAMLFAFSLPRSAKMTGELDD